jgi:hypothetical protein
MLNPLRSGAATSAPFHLRGHGGVIDHRCNAFDLLLRPGGQLLELLAVARCDSKRRKGNDGPMSTHWHESAPRFTFGST